MVKSEYINTLVQRDVTRKVYEVSVPGIADFMLFGKRSQITVKRRLRDLVLLELHRSQNKPFKLVLLHKLAEFINEVFSL